jgi:hypothetical protein
LGAARHPGERIPAMLQLIVMTVLTLSSTQGLAADVVPPSDPRSETNPVEPVPPTSAPAPPPSTIDPGIQKTPDTVPDPRSAVPPPNVDPEMVIDPEKPRRPDDAPMKNRPATPPLAPPNR